MKQSAQAKVLERKWLRFLLVHGWEYGFDKRQGQKMAQQSPLLLMTMALLTHSACNISSRTCSSEHVARNRELGPSLEANGRFGAHVVRSDGQRAILGDLGLV